MEMSLRATVIIAHGVEWADRCEIQDSGTPMPFLTQRRGCPECAGYGHPGWIAENRRAWKKCVCWRDEKPGWHIAVNQEWEESHAL